MKRYLVLALVLGLCHPGISNAAEVPADLIVHNARVLTVDSKFSIAEAVAVRGNASWRSATTRPC